MSVVVIKQGLLDTIQDDGRFGFQHLGINAGGSMDLMASNLANILVGNERNAPVIELHFPASSFMFLQDCLIAISGADFNPLVNDAGIPMNTPVMILKDSVLKFSQLRKGSRCYLAVHGGWNVDLWLNSYCTNLKVAAGGYKGKALKKNDELQIQRAKLKTHNLKGKPAAALPVKADISNLYSEENSIRCITGNEYEWLSDDAKNKFQSSSFKISPQSDRMGYRLEGVALEKGKEKELLSSAVTRGTIQLLPSGQLIILMADHQTTGGYPKIAHVISADFPKLAQKQPNESIQFALVAHAEAEKKFLQQQEYLQHAEDSIKLQLKQFLGE
jgi:antagonist of KipI